MAEDRPAPPDDEMDLGEIFEAILAFVVKGRWLILLTVSVIALSTIAVVRIIPNQYDSEATLVRYQPVAQGYVFGPNTIVTNAEALESVTQEVLSRQKLIGIINQFSLYPKAKQKGMVPDELVKLMRKYLRVEPLEPARPQAEVTAFKISFTADTPEMAQNVVTELVQAFVDANVRAREKRAERTTGFLKSQVEAARVKLAEQEQRLRDFKARHVGELPEQQQVNLVTISDLQRQLQTTLSSLGLARRQRDSLESSLNSTLVRLRSDKASLMTRVTARHPEALKKESEITRVEGALRQLKSSSAGSGASGSSAASEDPVLVELLKQVELNSREIESLTKDEVRLRGELQQYQNRVNVAPVLEQELAGLTRDYELTKQDYNALLNKQLQSELAGNLEERGEGVQFRLVDPPSLPVSPSRPPRLKFSLGGAVAGLLVGLVFAFIRQRANTSFHSEKSISKRFPFPIVVGVPLLLTPGEEQWRWWRWRLEWAAGLVLMTAVLAAEYYVFRHG